MNQKELAHRCFLLQQQVEKLNEEIKNIRGVLLTNSISNNERADYETIIKKFEDGIRILKKCV